MTAGIFPSLLADFTLLRKNRLEKLASPGGVRNWYALYSFSSVSSGR